MLDSHCHLDRYQEPKAVAEKANRDGVFVIAVTNLPSHFEMGSSHLAKLGRVRQALGLHPLAAEQHAAERQSFRRLFSSTSFVGEVGLDFSREGKATADVQTESFRMVATLLASHPKFVTLHSRGAERETLQVLKEFAVGPAVFHWFSGALNVLDDALNAGNYFSINPAMIESEKGRTIVARLPRERVLTETDGPFVKSHGKAAEPIAVKTVEAFLADGWGVTRAEAGQTIWNNFRHVLGKLGLLKSL